MTNLITGKDSLVGKLKGRLGWWLAGAASALVLAGLTLAPTSSHAQTATPTSAAYGGATAGATYSGSVESVGTCGGGSVSVTVGSGGDDLASASVTGVNTGTSSVSGSSSFASGTVPIAADGSFSTYFSADGGEITVAGTFDGNTLTGYVLGSPSTCGRLDFSAVAGATAAAPTATVGALPRTGNGSDDSTGALWAIVGGVIAVLALAAGAVFLRRRSA